MGNSDILRSCDLDLYGGGLPPRLRFPTQTFPEEFCRRGFNVHELQFPPYRVDAKSCRNGPLAPLGC